MLRDATFEIVYSTGENDPIEFYIEALMESQFLDLGLGFFSSSGFKVLSHGFAYFLSQGGKVRLIINNILTEKDKEAISKGLQPNRGVIIEKRLVADIKSLQKTLSKQDCHFFNCLSWLISKDKISIISIVPKDNNIGIAHQKFGIFIDRNSDKVAFTGSLNFSESAFLYNLETISCYRSWTDEKDRVNYYNTLFRKIWTGQNPYVEFVPIDNIKTTISNLFPVSNIEELLGTELDLIDQKLKNPSTDSVSVRLNKLRSKILSKGISNSSGHLANSSTLQPRDYQQEAIDCWIKDDYKGFFEMATGTGKTYTALFASLALKEKLGGKCFILVLVPTISLAEQWKKEIKNVGYNSVIVVSSFHSKWDQDLTRAINAFKLGSIDHIVCISTYDSYKSDRFNGFLDKFPSQSLLIADEAHAMGAPQMLQNLPYQISNRLGLSATPHRHFDDSGTQRLLEFFSSEDRPTFKLGLKQAISLQFLCQYKLFPHLVELNEEEYESYIELTKKISRRAHIKQNKFEESDHYLEKLLRDRRNILNRASGKFEILDKIINKIIEEDGEVKHTLVYCPEGSDSEEDGRIIDKYGRFLGLEKGLRIGKFIGETTVEERQRLLEDFDSGKIQCLIAMKCLDEGVDIRQTKTAIFLASSTNPRQYVQRRGRVLRTHPKKSFAYLHDILAVPPNLPKDQGVLEVDKAIISQEMSRYIEFAEDAINYVEAIEPIKPTIEKYQLTI
ncbi:DEAD/DEAH box helicase family protein [Croceitalea marina]|uniref:DEAD/DEAH box helicase family protein n=1 Tax=Croceitalea marina TaxID=1775166 RepID=A0ABW5MSC6_9FLAO